MLRLFLGEAMGTKVRTNERNWSEPKFKRAAD